MKKNLIIINGTMGVGKTTLSLQLKEKLPKAVFFDGDWAWDMSPFVVNNTTKNMVMNNISYCINQFIESDMFENIILCWVLHEQSIIDDLLRRIDTKDVTVKTFTLMIDEASLKEHILKDVNANKRTIDVLERSIERLDYYKQLNTTKIDVTKQPLETILEMLS